MNPQGLKTSDAIDFWRAAHRALRGRYRAVLLAAAAGAALGAGIGLSFGQRLYSATGIVRLASAMPSVLKETDQNKPMAMFDGFIQAQREVMSGREVVDAAMKSATWRTLASSRSAPGVERFASCLKVETRPRSDHLQVRFTHPDPVVAAAAVQSLIAAYQEAFSREQQQAENARLDLLRTRRASIAGELDALQTRMASASGGRTLTEFEPLCQEVGERIRKLRSALTDVQIAIAGGPSLVAAPVRAAEDLPGSLAWYQARLAELERDLFEAKGRGLLPAHPAIQKIEAAIQLCKDQMNTAPQSAAAPLPDERPPVLLHEREASLRALLDSAQEEMQRLATEREQLKGLEDQAATVRQQLAETDSRLDALTTEGAAGGRLMVVTGGQRPMTAVLDNRAKMAAAGSFLGGAAPFGLLVALSILRRRYRSGEELADDLSGRVPFVAVLPDTSSDAASAALGARCVHDMRTRLAPGGATTPGVYLVTSPSPREGKTSVALSLALSFSAAGARTLIIDADLNGRALTLGFDAGDADGLIEAAAGAEPNVRRLRAGPSLLTTGRSCTQDACRLAPATLKRLLGSLRERFDVIIIDGDPTLTGITSSVIAPQTDGVILAVARGQRPTLALRAARIIPSLGATLCAAVFNRADAADFPARMRERAVASRRALSQRIGRFGPLVAGVLASLSLTRDDDMNLSGAVGPELRGDAPQEVREPKRDAA